MFVCERCGSAYSAGHVGVEHCPRCLLLERVQAPLVLKVFKLPDAQPGAGSPPQADELSTAVQPVRPAR